ncbi:hypothetical protein AHAS_Ahas02G0130600 [Arachis hypogaea]|uniref:Uncharacterized protein n=2 Tax=Arachis hypogaea TaxID=3818 RepID=A0A445EDN9_ARAHY|nr:hypothetical protein Ahy_A02g007793 isoform A [Arachis hypogaea]
MVGEQEGALATNRPQRLFVDVVKGGRRPSAAMETEDQTQESDDEEMNSEKKHFERSKTQGQSSKDVEKDTHEIKVERVDGICNVVINEAALKQLRHPWWDTLIVKLLGRRISLAVLTRRLEAMRGKQGILLPRRSRFCANRRPMENLHYLTISFWKPNFNPIEASIEYTAAWVRLPGLTIEYYEKSMLERIGNIIGRTIKVDPNTADICRGKFAKLCVELDLTARLVSHYSINVVKYVVEYEGIHNI